MALLRELGCDRGQGYHFSRPVEADAVAALLADQSAIVAAVTGDVATQPAG